VLEAIERDAFTALDLMDVTLGDNSGRVIHLLSASTVGVGYPVNVAAIANRLKWLRANCYIAGAVGASIGTPLFDCEIVYDGAPARHKRLTGLMLNNTRHVANFVAFPEARLDDGYFHAIEARAGALRQNLHNFSAASGLNFYSSARPQKVRDAKMRFASALSVLIDGEVRTDVIALEVRIAPRALHHCLRRAAQ